ncbi:MAG: HigA family addiction module antitoxin [Bacteroidota bacterium]|nr:HigA family addiction module antitoxin [Bacteroidota bacterium]
MRWYLCKQRIQSMDSRIDIVKGVHPGKFIERELQKKHLSQRALAEQTSIAYQTINASIAGRRSLTVEQALKIEAVLGYEEGFLALLQTNYEIKKYKDRMLENQFKYPSPHQDACQ